MERRPLRIITGVILPLFVMGGAVAGVILLYRSQVIGPNITCPATHPVLFVGYCFSTGCAGFFGGMFLVNLLLYYWCRWQCPATSEGNEGRCRDNCAIMHAILNAGLIVMMILLCAASPIP